MKKLSETQSFFGVRFDGRTCDTGSKLGFLMANIHFALAREDMAPSFKTELKKVFAGL
jgi:UTP--glucose-1-phosphate uridylyltransferase